MDLGFRDISSGAPEPDEIWIRPADPSERGRRDLASYVAEHGLEGLSHGEETPRTVVVSRDPTLDDLLATAFVERLSEGRELPAGAAALARYAALQREGLQPSGIPVAESIEGVFLAQRNAHGDDLTDPAVAKRFVGDWRRTATVLLRAAEDGTDPFRTALFGGPDFARERAFLAKDREVYRQDVIAGERWLVRIPGGPPKGSALLLREPKSLLAKQWARTDEEAPVGGAYLLLAVRRGPGHWVFSTDPVQRLPIRPLAEALQEAEAAVDPARAGEDPWFDGKPFGHTLVASPRGGSRLSDADVLAIARRWAGARRAPSAGNRRLALVAVGLAAALVAAGLAWVLKPRDAGPFPAIDFDSRGEPLDEARLAELKADPDALRGFALLIGVGADRRLGALEAVSDASKVYRMLRDRYGFAPEDMLLLVDEPERALEADGKTQLPVAEGRPDVDGVQKAIDRLGRRVGGLVDRSRTQVVFYYAGHGVRTGPGESVGYLALAGWSEDGKLPKDRRGYDMAHLPGDVRRKIGATHSLLLIDACYSGFTVNKRGDPSEDPSRVYERWDDPALAVITAGREDQQVPEGPEGSYFTEVLLEGLGAQAEKSAHADASKDGIVTDAELGAWLAQMVRERVKRAGSSMEQTPLYFRGLQDDDVGQFLFVRRPPR